MTDKCHPQLFANWIHHQHLFSVSCHILGHPWSWCLCHTRNSSVVSDAYLSASPVCLRVTVGPQHLSVTCGCSDPCPKNIYANIPTRTVTHCPPGCLPTVRFVITLNYELFGIRIVFRSLTEYQFAISRWFCCRVG